jgi:FkbM family methyltransferase
MNIIEEIRNQWNSGVPHETDFYFFRNLTIDRPVCVDVGANAGQSVVSFAATCQDAIVVSFEPNTRYSEALGYIRKTLMPDGRFSFHPVGCGKESTVLELIVPYVGGDPYFQEASLSAEHFEIDWVKSRLLSYGGALTFQSLPIKLEPMDSFELNPHVCKIDAEGWEYDVLIGMERTIEKHHPIFLIENNDYSRVTDFLGQRGYWPYMYDAEANRLSPLTMATANTFYLRPEHFGSLVPSILLDESTAVGAT